MKVGARTGRKGDVAAELLAAKWRDLELVLGARVGNEQETDTSAKRAKAAANSG